MKKRVISLYRVSTKKQVDYAPQTDREVSGPDIPLQRQACRGFIRARPDWELYRELSEFGVSGYKVSAKRRDAIQEIQQEALRGSFDILLVFMFDRLGRIDDETPFVVEWFVKHGIKVWSVKEGEQRFENHVDKLINYIRFWQASGESEKTSIRTKERLSQIVQEGRYRGGTVPFGYRLVKRGRLNKRGFEVNEIEVDEQESAVVRSIFDLYITKGYGPQRISTYLTEHGVLNRKGVNFTNVTIRNMLRNVSYTGVLKSGETITPVFPDLQIITPEIFEKTKQSMEQRQVVTRCEKRALPNTRSKALLPGMVFCGHCGARLIVTTNHKKYVRKDGGITTHSVTRYVCYNKTRHKYQCDGQTGYSAKQLDKIVDEAILSLFAQIKNLPNERIIEDRCIEQITESQLALVEEQAALRAYSAEVKEYAAEVIKVIRGESRLSAELLNRLYEEAKESVAQSEEHIRDLEAVLKDRRQIKITLTKQFAQMQFWADMYDISDQETKKMILSKVLRAVRVRRGYEIEIAMTSLCEQLGISELIVPT